MIFFLHHIPFLIDSQTKEDFNNLHNREESKLWKHRLKNSDHWYSAKNSLVFGEKQMQERLPKPVYTAWKKTVSSEGTLDRQTADSIAHAMKRWALENGATHYTHWFQPLTGATAEKHDAFVEPGPDHEPITHFSGKNLIKGEPDASSFPSGGLRATFEARGYTYWDVTSPAFIKDGVLCIPTVFVSYNGESLDKKDPLLKSIKALSDAATKVVNLLGEKDVRSCKPYVGLEQEYFLIDRKYFEERPDLRLTGRTLFGAPASKGQELSDHYFGSIPTRVAEFMKDVNKELWKLGIYAKTEHNEVAACLLYEKPFDGINGSGKHNNWSILTDNGSNLFAPGEKPAENIRFLTFICAFIRAVDDNALLLRMSASSAGNDHRLGANEAPPAIISVYLGSYIEQILYGLYMEHPSQSKNREATPTEFNPISGLSYIPHDNTDRNRTSPVAFTGNKFEFRMLGSSMSAAVPNIVLNSIMAESLNEIAEELEGIKYLQDVRAKALDICRNIIHDHKRILFSGDGYSSEWVKEAKRRGLPNVRSFVESIEVLEDKKTVKMLTDLGVYTEKELAAREEIYREQYIKQIGIEVRTLLSMTRKDILPAMTADLKFYSDADAAAGKAAPAYLKARVTELSELIDETYKASEMLEKDFTEVNAAGITKEAGKKMYYDICPEMEKVRSFIDKYEVIATPDNYKLPTYVDMLFSL